MGILGPNYRTYVLNDFSLVRKAVFFILKSSGGSNAIKYSVAESLPVQINPCSISQKVGAQSFEYDTLGNLKNPHTDKEQVLEVELKYNIYDEYKVSTLDGAIPRDLSLTNKNVVTLEKLKSYAGKLSTEDADLCRTLFKWGDMEWFGALLFVDVEYTSFSRWGDPLSATAKVGIQKEYLSGFSSGIYAKDDEDKPSSSEKLGGLAKAAISTYSLSSDAMMLLESTASRVPDAKMLLEGAVEGAYR